MRYPVCFSSIFIRSAFLTWDSILFVPRASPHVRTLVFVVARRSCDHQASDETSGMVSPRFDFVQTFSLVVLFSVVHWPSPAVRVLVLVVARRACDRQASDEVSGVFFSPSI